MTPADTMAQVIALKDRAYRERNQCVMGLCLMALQLGYTCGRGIHDPRDKSWDMDWRNLVFIELPTGQVSWHIHDNEMKMFSFLPELTYSWDGHDVKEKYARLLSLKPERLSLQTRIR